MGVWEWNHTQSKDNTWCIPSNVIWHTEKHFLHLHLQTFAVLAIEQIHVLPFKLTPSAMDTLTLRLIDTAHFFYVPLNSMWLMPATRRSRRGSFWQCLDIKGCLTMANLTAWDLFNWLALGISLTQKLHQYTDITKFTCVLTTYNQELKQNWQSLRSALSWHTYSI